MRTVGQKAHTFEKISVALFVLSVAIIGLVECKQESKVRCNFLNEKKNPEWIQIDFF